MLPFLHKPPISHRRKAFALAVAGAADMLQMFIIPLIIEGAASPLEDAIDLLTAFLLTAICGFKWQFLLAFFMELVPGLDVLPTWSAVALLIPSQSPTLEIFAPPVAVPPQHPPIEGSAIAIPPIQRPS